MVESLFSALSIALGKSYFIALAAAFGWGILSILLSPCHLTGIPLVIGYISSHGRIKVKRTIALSLLFASGSLVTIATIGVITTALGKMLGDTGAWGSYVIAGVFIVMGLYLIDLIGLKWNGIPLADEQRGGLWGAFLPGLLLSARFWRFPWRYSQVRGRSRCTRSLLRSRACLAVSPCRASGRW